MRLVDIDARECWACAHHCKNGGCSVWCENGEAFELRADLKEATIVEVVPVVHGEWIQQKPDEEVSPTKIPIARIEITDDMLIAHALCGEDSDCAECPCCIGTDGCVFDYVTE